MIHFGTGGWRAVIGEAFTKANIQLLSSALAGKMKAEGAAERGIVIGYDRRFLSREAMQWAGEVFAAEGIRAHLINKSGPTPVVMFTVREQGFPYGMMITASHNPALYNGIKVFTSGGRDADETATADIERRAERIIRESERLDRGNDPAMRPGSGCYAAVKTLPFEDARRAGLIVDIAPFNAYLDSILALVDTGRIRQAGLHIALDPMYGVSETSIKTILLTCRADVVSIHSRHDTLFGRRLPSPTREAMEELSRVVRDNACDIGIATDGDADRIGVVDDTGRYLTANDILALLYYYLLAFRGLRGGVVRNICTTHLLDRIAASFGERAYEVPVGFKHISAKMEETDALIGGESSGGLTVRGHIRGKDGVYAAALLAEMLAVTGMKLSELSAMLAGKYGAFHMEEMNCSLRDGQKEKLAALIMEEHRLPEALPDIDRVCYPDGCKVYFKNGGWVSCRFSGTEPLIRVFAEMPTREEAEAVLAAYAAMLKGV